MKKFLLLVLCFFAVLSAQSQAFYGGVALGGVTSQIDGDYNDGFHKFGFTGGGFVGLELSDVFDIQLELKYIQKGSSSSVDDAQHFKIRLNYIEMPFLAAANLGFINVNGKKIDWVTFELGLSLDALINASQQINGANESIDSWRRVCLNGILGLKFNITQNLEIGARVITSITSAHNGNFKRRTVRFWHVGAFNDVLELVLYYRFK